jgi:hypothetical protein
MLYVTSFFAITKNNRLNPLDLIEPFFHFTKNDCCLWYVRGKLPNRLFQLSRFFKGDFQCELEGRKLLFSRLDRLTVLKLVLLKQMVLEHRLGRGRPGDEKIRCKRGHVGTIIRETVKAMSSGERAWHQSGILMGAKTQDTRGGIGKTGVDQLFEGAPGLHAV